MKLKSADDLESLMDADAYEAFCQE